MKCNFLLIDGFSLLFRMFFGLPAKIRGKNNQLIHGIVGFTGTLLKTISYFEPEKVLVVFDSELGSFRQQLDSNYKANRIKDWSSLSEDMNPFIQLPDLKKVLDYLSIKHCEIENVEADDVLSEYARRYNNENKIVIVSTDSDLLQLVNENVYVYYPKGKSSVLYDEKEVDKKYNLKPALIADMKAIVGDKSDNILGVPGIGIKTAQKLFNKHGNLSSIYDNINDIENDRIKKKLLDYKEEVFLNLKLIKLNRKVDLKYNLEELKLSKDFSQYKTMQVLKDVGLT
ncbi:5'-3' exonuclease H3TH domain-containing protein [Sporosalibacterium faouarense]|uniref:5'-3' exonuclease H3TH domain-containing protein n=1 Tax=Sporosalibacterium faouarense TaxID=516123 RepID=UPI00192B969F